MCINSARIARSRYTERVALPPTVPTSFVPKQPVATGPRRRTTGTNPFLMLSYVILIVALAGCAATFGYQLYLEGVAKSKTDQVTAAVNKIDQTTVTEFIRLRDRFTSAQDILNRQVALSQFFLVLENLTLQNVRFTSLKVLVANDRTATVNMNGTAKTFNALAAQSAALASDKRIKRAIFSGIEVKDSIVSFALTADLDPSLVERSAASVAQATAPAAPAATTTAP